MQNLSYENEFDLNENESVDKRQLGNGLFVSYKIPSLRKVVC